VATPLSASEAATGLMELGSLSQQPGPINQPAISTGSTMGIHQQLQQGVDQNGADMMSLLLDIRTEVRQTNRKLDTIEKTVDELKAENEELKAQNEKLTRDVGSLEDRLDKVESKVEKNAKKHERLESQVKKSNLKFFGIAQPEDESADTVECTVKKAVSQNLGLHEDDYEIERATRLKSQMKPSPILVQFTNIKHRNRVIDTFRSKRKTNQLPIRVGEDLPERISKARTGLYPLLAESLNQKKHAYFNHEYLYVDGKKYEFDESTQSPVLIGNNDVRGTDEAAINNPQ